MLEKWLTYIPNPTPQRQRKVTRKLTEIDGFMMWLALIYAGSYSLSNALMKDLMPLAVEMAEERDDGGVGTPNMPTPESEPDGPRM